MNTTAPRFPDPIDLWFMMALVVWTIVCFAP